MKQKLLIQKTWRDVMFNRMLVSPDHKYYTQKDDKKNYHIFTAKTLIQDEFKLIIGNLGSLNWMMVIDIGEV